MDEWRVIWVEALAGVVADVGIGRVEGAPVAGSGFNLRGGKRDNDLLLAVNLQDDAVVAL